jgi:hypothetical protein
MTSKASGMLVREAFTEDAPIMFRELLPVYV